VGKEGVTTLVVTTTGVTTWTVAVVVVMAWPATITGTTTTGVTSAATIVAVTVEAEMVPRGAMVVAAAVSTPPKMAVLSTSSEFVANSPRIAILDGVGVSIVIVEGPSTTGVTASGRSEVVATPTWAGLLVAGARAGVLLGAREWPVVGDGPAMITAGRVERAAGRVGRAVGFGVDTSTVASVSMVAAGEDGIGVKNRLRKRG
jgi:hypothetical protein